MLSILFWIWIAGLGFMFVFMFAMGIKDMREHPEFELDFPTILLGSTVAALFWPFAPAYIWWNARQEKNEREEVTMDSIRTKTEVLEKQLKIGKYSR